MKSIIPFGCLLVLTLFFAACTTEPEIIDIPLDDSNPKLVVEGLITNQPGPYYVKLSLSTSYYNTGGTPKVNDATVIITDNTGRRETLTRAPGQDGVYRTRNLRGVVGNTYYLTINYKGQEYKAESLLPTGITLDKLTYAFVPQRGFLSEGYYVFMYGREPKPERNYYRWYLYRNDTLNNGRGDIFVEDDQFYPEEVDSLMYTQRFNEGDRVKIEVHSLTKEAAEYYTGLANVLNNDGGLISSPPKNPKGNISNGALGIFRASKVSTAQVEIK